jgi:hypothetical protein
MPDAADSLQPLGSNLVAHGTDAVVQPVAQLALRVVGDKARITCPPDRRGDTARGIIKRFPPWDWLTGDRVWTVSAQWAEPLAAALTSAGYDVQVAGSVVPARVRRTVLPECPGVNTVGVPCRAPFRIGTPLPVKCSQCGTRITSFYLYDPDE